MLQNVAKCCCIKVQLEMLLKVQLGMLLKVQLGMLLKVQLEMLQTAVAAKGKNQGKNISLFKTASSLDYE